MVKSEHLKLWLHGADKTDIAGQSLARTLYTLPITIGCRGQVGTGKTTFIQGFAKGIGISENITSPTFALEQRYRCLHGRFLHLDLYRLHAHDAEFLLESSAHDADIRCVEWIDKIEQKSLETGIDILFFEEGEGRNVEVIFRDIAMPEIERISEWQEEVYLPIHIRNHCRAVANVAEQCADALLHRGIFVRKEALRRAALLHDLLRFVDFHPKGSTIDFPISADAAETWAVWKHRYNGQKHEVACAHFLEEQGFPALARIVLTHGLSLPSLPKVTTEQQLLFYADKRVKNDEIVSLQERFQDFEKRYGHLHDSANRTVWYEESLAIEKILFPEGVPEIKADELMSVKAKN